MKKTLIALAALASTAAFAQSTVNLTGKFGVAFQQAPGAVAGLAVTDGDVVFSAVEDLGGGMKAAASMAVKVRGRVANVANTTTGAITNSIDGRDATVSLMGGFGTVTLGAVEAGNGIVGRGFAGAPVSLADGYDGSVLAGASNVDLFKYTSPALIPGLTASYTRIDSVGAPGGGKGALQANVVGVDYAAGPISAGLDITSYSTAGAENRTRASASYNLGVATVGLGVQKTKGTDTQIAMGVSVPLGAITAGLVYAKNGDKKGFGVGANYALSKRTVINASFGKIDAGGADGSATNDNQYRIRVMHSF